MKRRVSVGIADEERRRDQRGGDGNHPWHLRFRSPSGRLIIENSCKGFVCAFKAAKSAIEHGIPSGTQSVVIIGPVNEAPAKFHRLFQEIEDDGQVRVGVLIT